MTSGTGCGGAERGQNQASSRLFNGDKFSELIVDDAERVVIYHCTELPLLAGLRSQSNFDIPNVVFQATSRRHYWQEAILTSRGTSPILTG